MPCTDNAASAGASVSNEVYTACRSPRPPPSAAQSGTKTPAASSSVSVGNDGDDARECRICREGDTVGPLISPCKCRSVVHATCLRKWVGYRADALFPVLSTKARHTCEVCRAPLDLPPGPSPPQESIWAGAFTLETCVFVFLLVLAIMGHALFVMGVFKGAVQADEHSHKRIVLALANAILTIFLLICLQKLILRWLREAQLSPAPAPTPTPAPDIESQDGAGSNNVGAAPVVEQRYATRCTTVAQVVLGALLSVVAAAEIFLIIRELPLGGIA